jgi:hypothetical protein
MKKINKISKILNQLIHQQQIHSIKIKIQKKNFLQCPQMKIKHLLLITVIKKCL